MESALSNQTSQQLYQHDTVDFVSLLETQVDCVIELND